MFVKFQSTDSFNQMSYGNVCRNLSPSSLLTHILVKTSMCMCVSHLILTYAGMVSDHVKPDVSQHKKYPAYPIFIHANLIIKDYNKRLPYIFKCTQHHMQCMTTRELDDISQSWSLVKASTQTRTSQPQLAPYGEGGGEGRVCREMPGVDMATNVENFEQSQ